MAALAYAGDLMRLRSRPRLRAGSDAGGDSGEEASAGPAGVDAAAAGAYAGSHAAGQPHSLRERVLQAFSTHELPVHKPLSLPTLSLELACPGEPVCASVLAACDVVPSVHASVAANAVNAVRLPLWFACPCAPALACLWVYSD